MKTPQTVESIIEERGERRVSLPRCNSTEAGLECIGHNGRGVNDGCGWRGCEMSAPPKSCNYTWQDGVGITGYVLDSEGDDSVCICPQCGGECAHTPLNEVKHPECVWDRDFICECGQQANMDYPASGQDNKTNHE